MPTPDHQTSPAVLIVDDHVLFSTSVEVTLRGRGINAVRAKSLAAEEVRSLAARLRPALVLLDLDLGADADGRPMDGTTLARGLSADGWTVLILTGSTDRQRVAAAVAAGAAGWLSKAVPFDDLIYTILDGFAGRPVMDVNERERLLAEYRAVQAERRSGEQVLGRLTRRERQVLSALEEGKRATVIAQESFVSISTVRSQIRSILAKLNVQSQLEAVALAKSLRR
ncbi:LuxR C-terminal-related transcriptional regulator [Actinorugispora endophytica]|uniref:DNA-binding NarL/FixJ family response regulator n=1 Tax=Actinorugispora endophytica TaxID=1605990 RepID=A0A4R6V7D2_9ACTN|nr:response regulator transcription factor [Actinorugispora endophytica]TDQ52203.1 DNA-binding NarL/FixJ family response regulator [Actinorugispora endophytica]